MYDQNRKNRDRSQRRLTLWLFTGFVLTTGTSPRLAFAQAVGNGPLTNPPLIGNVGPPRTPGYVITEDRATVPAPPEPNIPGSMPSSTPDSSNANPKIIDLGPKGNLSLPFGTAPFAQNPQGADRLPGQPEFPLVNPIEGPPRTNAGPKTVSAGKFINLRRDTTGLLPDKPPGPPVPRPVGEIVNRLDDLIEQVQTPEAEISLVIGQSKLLETRRALTRIVIGNPGVADVSVINDQPNSRLINLSGLSFGTTTLTLWDGDQDPSDRRPPVTFLVRVTLDTKDLEARVAQVFPGAVIHIRQVGPQLILEGQVPDSKTMAEVMQLITIELRNSGRAQPGSGGSSGTNAAAAQGAAQGAAAGATTQGASPASAASGAAAGASSGAGGGGLAFTIINRVHVPGPRQVLLHVKIAELNRTAIRQIGVSWLDPKNNAILGSTIGGAGNIAATAGSPVITQAAATGAKGAISPIASSFGSSATATNADAQLFGIFNAGQFSIFLNALRSNAMAKILAEPNLMALDGQPARFLAGGLFPYPVPQSSSIPGGTAVVTVQFANFGAILSFLPHILANDVIRLDVEPVFSALNFGSGTTINGGRVPAIDQRSARTIVELREGQTLAIAGLLQTTTNATVNRVPFLGDLPLVGNLFSSLEYNTVETELVVLVTPELVAPMDPNEVPPGPGDRVTVPNDYEFFFLGRIEGKLGREFRDTIAEHDPLNVMKHFQSENHWVIGPHGHSD